MKIILSHIYLFFIIFTAACIIVSLNIGFFTLNPPVILAISLFVSFLLFKKYHFIFPLPRRILFLCLLMGILLAYPTVIRTAPTAADPAQTIVLRVLDTTIPKNFEPYSGLSFTYQFGYQLFVNLFSDIIPSIPDYLHLWFFGVIFGSLQIISLYLFTLTLTKNNTSAFYSCLLLFGTKAIYRDILVGGFATVLAINLLLLASVCFMKRNRLAYLFFPAIFVLHPQIGALTILILVIYSFLFRDLRRFMLLIPSILLVIPTFFTTYAALFYGFFLPSAPAQQGFSGIIMIPLFIGIVPSFFAAIGLLQTIKSRIMTKEKMFSLILLFFISGLYLLLEMVGVLFVTRFLELDIIAAAFFAGICLTEIKPEKKRVLQAIVLILSVTIILTSGELNKLRFTGKISPEELEFSRQFAQFDPTLERVFFMSPGGAKIAEYSNKIPFDAKVDWYLPYFEKQVFNDEGFRELNERHAQSEDILLRQCISCIENLDVKYLVVNTARYNITATYERVFEFNHFIVYKII